ncbi:fumble-domain-containing protein [Entophlyctis helioformis]|nr:fumble-domain-containing protein [Entophlyctis helioformis]
MFKPGSRQQQQQQQLNTKGAAISLDEENGSQPKETSDILLPNQEDNIAHIAVDIGGSLAKVVWFSKSPETVGGRLNFVKFETQHIDRCIDFIGTLLEENPQAGRVIEATGGGAHKYYDLISTRLGVQIQKEDEMECLITGLNFLVRQIAYEVFTYDERRPEPMQFDNSSPGELFPYLLVNIGSGVSIIKVTSDETYERISGTSLGGGTLWGLLSLLTDAKDYDEMLDISKTGDNKNVDMLVGDIYGGDYPKIGLKGTTIASSFGKVFKTPAEERKSKFKQADIAVSLLYLVSNNIGQIAYLNAQAHGIQRIYFSGFFIRGHPITMNTLSYAISFWSKGKIKALFLRHEGYLGAVGAFLRHTPAKTRLASFMENFSHTQKISGSSVGAVGSLEEYPADLCPFPLIREPAVYVPDTSDLRDPELQRYWIDLLDVNLEHLVSIALKWEGQTNPGVNVKDRAATFEKMYREHLKLLRKEPNAYGVLTVRSLLNLREQCLREMGFTDIFHGIKQDENRAALQGLGLLVSKLDSLDEPERLDVLVEHILAGNMYDCSTVIQEMLKRGELDFSKAKQSVGKPSDSKLYNYPDFKAKILGGHVYRKAVILVDNSGADIMFGIIPFARYLLSKGTAVVLGANSHPAVNDITADELKEIARQIATQDAVFRTALADGTLAVVETGSGSPCLDLMRVSQQLASAVSDVDLVVLEGMGRAIHTNFHAKFLVDSVKVAVFKNPHIAAELGAAMYDGMFVFESVV